MYLDRWIGIQIHAEITYIAYYIKHNDILLHISDNETFGMPFFFMETEVNCSDFIDLAEFRP